MSSDKDKKEKTDEKPTEKRFILDPIVLRTSAAFDYPTRVECLSKDYIPLIKRYMKQYYIPRYILWNILALTENGLIEYERKVENWIREGTSFALVHQQKNILLGFMIGSVWDVKDYHREVQRVGKFKTMEVRALSQFLLRFHEIIDLFLIHNTEQIYVIHIWMIAPGLKRYHYAVYEFMIALFQFCDLVDARGVCAIATNEKEKLFAEKIGFNLIKKVYYLDWLSDYPDVNLNIVGQEYSAYFLSLFRGADNRGPLRGTAYEVLPLPQVTKNRKKLKNRRYWQELYWSAFNSSYFTPSTLRGENPDFILI